MNEKKLPIPFIESASTILANGLTGRQIIEFMNHYGKKFSKTVPINSYPFEEFASSKKKALTENLSAFSESEKYSILLELCEPSLFGVYLREDIDVLRKRLTSEYAHFQISQKQQEYGHLAEKVCRNLRDFPESLKLFCDATDKLYNGIFQRNTIDDLRLSIELLFRNKLKNDKSLENQTQSLGAFLKKQGASVEFRNMFEKLIEYFCKYQNTYAKHDDNVPSAEIDFIFEFSCVFLNQFAKISVIQQS